MMVSVLIVTFNSEGVIRECLESVLRSSYSDFEVLIYDNASSDNTVNIIEDTLKYREKVKLISSKFNRGFGYGLNRLVDIARGEIIVSLNPDTEVREDWIEKAVRHFSKVDTGMVATRVLFRDIPDTLDSAGHLLYPDGLNRGRGHNLKSANRFTSVEEVAFPSGAAGFYRRELYQKARGIDESLFLFGDDTDIGLKIRLLGYRCIYEPESVVYHKYSSSVGRYSDLKAYYVERNRLIILLKYFPPDLILGSIYYTFKRFLFHNISAILNKGSTYRYIERGSIFRLYLLMFMAYGDVILGLPEILDSRKRLPSEIRREEMKKILREFSISVKEMALSD